MGKKYKRSDKGKTIFQRQNNPSYKLMESVNKQIAAIEGQLATSRKDRMSMENKNVDAVAAWLEKVSSKLPKKQSNIISTQQANDILTED
jgi:cob(I)alamin adenosyltransferase